MRFSINNLPNFFGIPWLVGVFFVLQIAVVLILAFAVRNDAETLRRDSRLFLVGPWVWFGVVVLAGGYLPSLAYWLIHHSALRSRREDKA